jgi:NADPH:quinone reductase-like Zn-dependent oxidoreductase
MLRSSGADQVFLDNGTIAKDVRRAYPKGVEKVLELIGTTTLEDSLQCVREGGVVCMTGIVGNKWAFENFAPMDQIPTAVCLTSYAGESDDFMST